MKQFIAAILFLFIICISAPAQNIPDDPSISPEETTDEVLNDSEKPANEKPVQPDTIPVRDEIIKVIDYNAANSSKNSFSAHKPNYVLPFTISDYTGDGREKYEIKFQISFKQRCIHFKGWAFYLAYTQKSLWQAFDSSNSRPFRESNFNPELFIRTSMLDGWRLDFGGEHESNGKSMPESRGWNRLYLTPYFENDYVRLSLKTWYRFPEKEKTDPNSNGGDDNPDIQKYYGYNELGLTVKIKNLYLETLGRWNFRHKRGAFCLNASMPFKTNTMKWFIQYWEGYGESLIDYNVRQRKFGIGAMFTR